MHLCKWLSLFVKSPGSRIPDTLPAHILPGWGGLILMYYAVSQHQDPFSLEKKPVTACSGNVLSTRQHVAEEEVCHITTVCKNDGIWLAVVRSGSARVSEDACCLLCCAGQVLGLYLSERWRLQSALLFSALPVRTLHCEAEKRNQFSFVCICLIFDRNWWIFFHIY